MVRKSPSRVWPEDTGGMGTYEAKEKIVGILDCFPALFGVMVGPWSMKLKLQKTGVVRVQLDFTMWKKGWNPPPEPADKEKPAKKAAGRKTAKSAG